MASQRSQATASSIHLSFCCAVLPTRTHAKKTSAARILERRDSRRLEWSLHPDGVRLMIRQSSLRSACVLSIGILLSLASTAASADERCAQLVALNKQYARVALTRE